MTTSCSSFHPHLGDLSTICFLSKADSGLTVTIDTPHLHMRSVTATEEDIDRYADLFGNPEVMQKYATGQTKTREEIVERISNSWAQRWHESDPYSGFAVFKTGTHEFVGHVILDHGDAPGEAEAACLLMPSYWHNGYATEAVTALVKEYAPATVEEGYTLEGKKLEKIVATARVDNVASCRILDKLGSLSGTEEKYGSLRNRYIIQLNRP